MSQQSSEAELSRIHSTSSDAEYQTLNLLRFSLALRRRKNLVVACAAGGFVIATALAFLLPPKYDSVARFLPPAPKEAVGGLSLLPSTRNSGDRYLGLISSRSVATDVIEHQHLMEYFHAKNLSQALAKLDAMSTIKTDKDQFVTVTVRAKEAQTALNIAREYINALQRLDNSLTAAESQHRRAFFEGPIEQEKNKLADAEEALKLGQEKTGMVAPEAQVRLGVGAIADLNQQITVLQAHLAALRTGGTEQNPQIIELNSQIASLQAQVERLKQQTEGNGNNRATKMPELTLEVERRTRDVKYHETLFEILSRQYENARVEQAYTPSIELVDPPVMPDQKAWPPRKIFMIAGLFLGAFLGMAYVVLAEADLSRRWRQMVAEHEALVHADVSRI
jgi:tyrosine-protein kinase Etk/Wzc